MRIRVGFVIKRPGVRRGANIQLPIWALVGAVPVALICRPIRGPGRASFCPVRQRPDAHTHCSVKRSFLIVKVTILLNSWVMTCDVQLPRVIVGVSPGVNWLQSMGIVQVEAVIPVCSAPKRERPKLTVTS